MRKQQKFSRGLSDKVRKSKAAPEIQRNAFEVKINRRKFDVLGRRSKHDVGLPGVSRSRAIQKRKETLLKEFRLKDKNNTFIDRRFGEYDQKITPEEKILQRFTLERQRTHDRKDMYNLNEEEELTHYGQSLAEMEKMTDVIDSDSDSEEKGLLSAELTATHFGGGGGLLRKKSAGDEDKEHKPKSRQELIEELIIKSKEEKVRNRVKEMIKLYSCEWFANADAVDVLSASVRRRRRRRRSSRRNWIWSGNPSRTLWPTKPPLKRMMGDAEEEAVQTNTHISADDMNDGFILDGDDRKTLAYKGGEKEDDDGDEEGGEEEDHADEEEEEEEDEEEDDHCDLQSDEGSEDEDGEGAEEEQVGAEEPPAVIEEQKKAAQEAARAELPYTFTDDMSLRSVHLCVCVFCSQICGLCQMFPEAACKAVQTLLSDSGHSMEETLEVKGRAPMPDLDMLVLLKITALLFPTSDFRHPVTTPAFLYISQALTRCAVVSLEDVCKGLILCCLALEFVSLSQRFFPELLNFLLGLLHLTLPDKHKTGYTVVSPFRRQGKNCDLLVLTDPSASHSWNWKPISLHTAHRIPVKSPVERDHCRLSVIDSCLDLVKRCTSLYKDLPSFAHIFQPIRTLLLKHLPVESYPAPIQDLHREILEAIPEQPSQHAPLVFKKKKPIPLKLFTPKIVQILDYGKKRGNTKEEKERERLQHKYKREFKGALREIRKDTRFLAREKLSDVMSRDAERKRKVKELYGSLATQEGEWKALKRKNRK
uniref:NOP14 nucleolar protein homolog (yeast) n=1 Tax=Sinocyclocheilus anshuiensis TaxID=1608454 RepID=A0A671PUV1_9TELE